MPKGGLQFWHLVVIVLLAAMLGTAAGDVLGKILPEGPIGRFLSAGVRIGTITPWDLDVRVLHLTLGLSLRVTVLGTLAAGIALIAFFRRV